MHHASWVRQTPRVLEGRHASPRVLAEISVYKSSTKDLQRLVFITSRRLEKPSKVAEEESNTRPPITGVTHSCQKPELLIPNNGCSRNSVDLLRAKIASTGTTEPFKLKSQKVSKQMTDKELFLGITQRREDGIYLAKLAPSRLKRIIRRPFYTAARG